ncbi:MAG: alpha/beta hydrolase, partial [Chloroflexota bacterium]|nr:alpha/beta hydrolase [Chloroflexota bacterium]
LYVKCMGRGGPTVILEAALANTSATWSAIQPEIARFTTVCSYDRAGLGRSEAGPTYPITAQNSVDELRALLQNAGIRGPYVLVGHSYGGWLVQLFARQDGGRRVTGVVLVDATPIDMPAISDRFGLPTPTPEQIPEPVDLRTSSQQVQAAPAFPQVPLDVLRRTVHPPSLPAEVNEIIVERQEETARLSCRGRLIVAEGAGHFIHRDRPDLVIASIEHVVNAAHPNNGRKLHPKGHPSPAGPQGSAGRGRWDRCP